VHAVDELIAEITTLASHISAATARWLELILEFDDRSGWTATGAKSLSHWVSYACSMSPAAAREHVRVARRLRDLPHIAQAFARGELSYSKVRAITRVEELEREDELLVLARAASASQLERVVRGYRSCLAVERDADEQYADRSLQWSWDSDGAFVLHGRFPAEQGAMLVRSLEAARDELGPPPSHAGNASAEATQIGDTVCARNADALLALAESSLESGAASTTADRYQVVVHVEADALASVEASGDNHDAGAHRCELDEGIPLPREAVRRLVCDASIVRIVERDGRPLSIGRKTRTIPPALRRALRSRDRGCTFPGCTQVQHVDAHHIEHWADGGKTNIANLVQLCRHHHRLLHEGGFSLHRSARGLVFINPDGDRLAESPRQPRGDCSELLADNQRRRVRASAEALWPTDGGRMDLGYAVDDVLSMRRPRRE
jgi:hypothetical protein